MSYKRVLVCLLLVVLYGPCLCQSISISDANEKYKNEAFGEANELYQSIYDEGYQSADMLYNMGNSYYKTGNIARSILNFERCLKIEPKHKQANQNLQIVNEQVQVQMSKIPEFFLLRYWNTLAKMMSSTAWSFFSFLLLTCSVVAIGFWLLHSEVKIKKKAFYTAIAMLVLFILSSLFGYTKSSMETSTSMAIVMKDEGALFSGPDERSDSIQPLSSGVKLKLTDEIDDWYKVELIDKEVGWVQKSLIETI